MNFKSSEHLPDETSPSSSDIPASESLLRSSSSATVTAAAASASAFFLLCIPIRFSIAKLVVVPTSRVCATSRMGLAAISQQRLPLWFSKSEQLPTNLVRLRFGVFIDFELQRTSKHSRCKGPCVYDAQGKLRKLQPANALTAERRGRGFLSPSAIELVQKFSILLTIAFRSRLLTPDTSPLDPTRMDSNTSFSSWASIHT